MSPGILWHLWNSDTGVLCTSKWPLKKRKKWSTKDTQMTKTKEEPIIVCVEFWPIWSDSLGPSRILWCSYDCTVVTFWHLLYCLSASFSGVETPFSVDKYLVTWQFLVADKDCRHSWSAKAVATVKTLDLGARRFASLATDMVQKCMPNQ